ncbi:MAG: permease prefix domain 2-containing transporter [Bacteroidota bacterium]
MDQKEEHINPPKWVDRFLEWYCADHLIDEIQGDLHEAYHYRRQQLGKTRANLWFMLDVIRFFRPSSFRKQKSTRT